MSKVLGSKKPYGRLPPKRGQVKLRILHLIIEIVKDMVNGLPEDNRHLVFKEIRPKQYSILS